MRGRPRRNLPVRRREPENAIQAAERDAQISPPPSPVRRQLPQRAVRQAAIEQVNLSDSDNEEIQPALSPVALPRRLPRRAARPAAIPIEERDLSDEEIQRAHSPVVLDNENSPLPSPVRRQVPQDPARLASIHGEERDEDLIPPNSPTRSLSPLHGVDNADADVFRFVESFINSSRPRRRFLNQIRRAAAEESENDEEIQILSSPTQRQSQRQSPHQNGAAVEHEDTEAAPFLEQINEQDDLVIVNEQRQAPQIPAVAVENQPQGAVDIAENKKKKRRGAGKTSCKI